MPPKQKLSKKERKLEKKRKALEKKRQILLDYLTREIKYGNVTRKKHEKDWKQIVTEISLIRIRSDLEFTWQIFDWTLDAKDCTISALMDELNQANDQYALTLQNHASRIDILLIELNEALKGLHEDYQKSLDDLNNYHQAQMEAIQKNFDEQHETLKVIIFTMQSVHTATMREQMAQHFCQVESLTSAFNEKDNLALVLGKKVGKMWAKSNNILKEYFKKYRLRMGRTQKERAALFQTENDIKKNLKKISYLVELVKKLQTKLNYLYSTDGEKLRQLKENHEEFSEILFILKNNLFRKTQLDNNKQKLLVLSSLTTLDNFKRIVGKGELTLKLMSFTKRYETLTEKVLPFPMDKFFMKLHHYSKKDIHSHESVNLEEKLLLFYQRMAAVEASRVALVEEKKVLQLERVLLEKKFEEYCGCIVCPINYSNFEDPKNRLNKFGHLERTKWTLYYQWKYQQREEKRMEAELRVENIVRKKIHLENLDRSIEDYRETDNGI